MRLPVHHCSMEMFSPLRRRLLPLAFLLCFSFADLLAQTPDTAILRGRATDTSQRAIAGVEISVENNLTGFKRKVTTDTDGSFEMGGLSIAGAYSVNATKSEFDPVHLTVTPEGGTTANLDFQMGVAGVHSTVVVTGALGEIRTDEDQIGNFLDTQQITQTPLPNRRITYLPLLNAANRPAINQGDVFMNQDLFTTNGQGRRQTWFELDGSNGIDMWGRQTVFSNVPIDAVQEMTVISNAFNAQYGFGGGSVVNIVSKSGTDQLHGKVLGMWRPAAPEAALSGFTTGNASSGNDITSDILKQGAGTLSGHLPRSVYYAGSIEYSAQDRASPVTSPIDRGSFVGKYRGYLGFLRLDHQINTANSVFLRANSDVFSDSNPNGIVGGNTLPTVARTFHRRTYSVELGETAVLSPTFLNNLRAQFQLASPITEFDPAIFGTQYVVPISSGGTFTSGTSQSALLMNRQYEVSDTASKTIRRNQIAFGGSVIVARNGGNSKEFGGPIYQGSFTYKVCTLSTAACESSSYLDNIANVASYTQSYGNASYSVDDTVWSLFLQNDLQLTRALTLNLGIRYEDQTFTDARKNVAPRAGFTYDLSGRGKTVFRGGFGIYYSQVVDNSQANYSLTGPTGVFNYSASAGQIGFPSTVASAPLPALPPSAPVPVRTLYIRPGRSSQYNPFFATSALYNYPNKLLNPYSEQWSLGLEQSVADDWILSVDYIGTRTVKIVRPLDLDAPASFIRTAQGMTRSPQAANCTRPLWQLYYTQHQTACNPLAATNPQPPYSLIQSDVNDGNAYYEALDVNLNHRFHQRSSLLISYVYSHTIDNVDPDLPSQNPNDPLRPGEAERGNALFDQRNRLVVSGYVVAPLRIYAGGVLTLAGGLPYNIVTGTTNSGDTGGTTDRPVINGSIVGRNTGRGTPIYDFSPYLERRFQITERVGINLRAEAFNALNHANFVGFSGTYGNGPIAGQGFGQPLAGVTNQLPAREMQFSADVRF